MNKRGLETFPHNYNACMHFRLGRLLALLTATNAQFRIFTHVSYSTCLEPPYRYM